MKGWNTKRREEMFPSKKTKKSIQEEAQQRKVDDNKVRIQELANEEALTLIA